MNITISHSCYRDDEEVKSVKRGELLDDHKPYHSRNEHAQEDTEINPHPEGEGEIHYPLIVVEKI
jgi:hypothetical protein